LEQQRMAGAHTAAGQNPRESALRASGETGRRLVPAWLLSAALHGAMFIAAALLIRDAATRKSPEPERPGGIVLVQPTSTSTNYLSESDVTASAGEAAASEAPLQESLPRPNDVPLDLSGVLPSQAQITGDGGSFADVLPGAGDLAPGVGPVRGVGGQAQTQVFGAQGIGTKFVYVFDRSGSMEGFGGRPLAAAKRELVKSLAPLDSVHEFQIIFYNENPQVFNPEMPRPPRLRFGTEQEKRQAESFVRSVVANGGTQHIKALRVALRMAPDVIFFLTDADDPQLTSAELDEIRRLNKAGTTINAIEFGSTSAPRGENFLMRLARENGGKHVYVDVTALPD
jgi:hypothetical protein